MVFIIWGFTLNVGLKWFAAKQRAAGLGRGEPGALPEKLCFCAGAFLVNAVLYRSLF